MKTTTLPPRTQRVKPVNSKRKKKRYQENYGDKADWIRDQPCFVTHRRGNVVAAHPVPKGRSKKEGLVPFDGEVETDWHGLSELKFEARYGIPKQFCRDAAAMYEDRWQCHLRGEAYDVEF